MKKIIFISILVLVMTMLILTVVYYDNYKKVEPFRCIAQFEQTPLVTNKQLNKINVSFSSAITVFFTEKNNGFLSMVGTVEVDGINYYLIRIVYLSLSPKTIRGMRKVTILSEKTLPIDNTPKDIWEKRSRLKLLAKTFFWI